MTPPVFTLRLIRRPYDAKHVWEIEGTYLSLRRTASAGRWVVVSFDRATNLWLAERNMLNAEFSTRAAALRNVEAFHALKPVPMRLEPDAKLVRVRKGGYQTPDRHWQVTRRTDGWDVWASRTETRDDAVWLGTLHEVRRYIGYSQLNTDETL